MRKAFIKKLIELTEKDKNIQLLTGDLGFSVLDDFKKKFPNNYLNVGLMESNMIGMAAGMAMSGKKVFVYSIIPFVTYRVLEQIRNDLCYQEVPVKIIGVGEGLSYGVAGTTHHSIEDIAIMSALPNMIVVSPGDPIEVEKAVEESLKLDFPCYIRLAKSGDPIINNTNIDFKIGKGLILKKGKDVLIVSTGNMLEVGSKVIENLKKMNISAELISMHTLKPFDEDLLVRESKGKKLLVSIEEHVKTGGLGSKVADVLFSNEISVKFLKVCLPDKFIHIVGDQKYLRDSFGLTPNEITNKIIKKLEVEK
jgi:transketolase